MAPLSNNPRLIGNLLFAIMLVGGCGCGGTATIKGKVSYQGRPVKYGYVIFLGDDKTARYGIIEPDGSYTVEGVQRGEVKIGVVSRDPSKGRSIRQGDKPAKRGPEGEAPEKVTPEDWFPLPSKFEDPATSDHGCNIASGRVTHDIDLK